MEAAKSNRWYSNDCVSNSRYLFERYPGVFAGMAAQDQLGHSILEGAMAHYSGLPWETTVGFALLRRAVAQFAGVRYLCEHSAVQQGSLVARALFETLLAARYLAYGGRRFVSGLTPTTARGREVRARYYRTEEIRREIYRRQAAIDDRFGSRGLSRSQKAAIGAEIQDRLSHLVRRFPVQHRRFGPLLCFPRPNRRPKHFDLFAWYTFGFRGERREKITNVRRLAEAFGWLRDYELLYEAFSGFAHVRGLRHDTDVEPGSVAVRVPHAPDDFETIVYFCIHWQFFILTCMSRAYYPPALVRIQIIDPQLRPSLDALRGSLPLGVG